MGQRPLNIETKRLLLVCLLPEDIEALIAGDVKRVAIQTGFTFPPDDPNRGVDLLWHLKALRTDPNQLAWRIRVIVERASNTIVGSINLKGAPNADGDVEIGWGLNENARRKGYATEASGAVLNWIAQQPGVNSVSAIIPDDNNHSQRLATKLGFIRTAESRRNLPLWKCDRNFLVKTACRSKPW